MTINYKIRKATLADENSLWSGLYEAAHMHESGQTIAEAKANKDLARYVHGWGQSGDIGFIAESQKQFIGAAWLRWWSPENKGYGFIDYDIPELAIGVVPEWTGKGVGTRLLTELIGNTLRSSDLNLTTPSLSFQCTDVNGPVIHCKAISLSVRLDNGAVRLYERLGFAFVSGTQMQNRTGGQSATMLLTTTVSEH